MTDFPTDEEKTLRRKWTYEELAVLVTIYFHNDFAIGDDGRSECQLMADSFGRSTSAVDRQWRNVDSIVKSKPAFNVGALVRETVVGYLNNPVGVESFAGRTCETRGWPLSQLLVGAPGVDPETPVEAAKSIDPQSEVVASLRGLLEKIELKSFSSGSKGFFVQGKITAGGLRYQSQVSAVLIGSRNDPMLQVHANERDVQIALSDEVSGIARKTFSSGKQGYYLSLKLHLKDQRFQVSMQAVAIGG